MGFSEGQQPALRQYLAMAWAEHCRQAGASVASRCPKSKRCGLADSCDYCAWYESVLEGATGETSTTACNAGRDYEQFMRALELIHEQGIAWQVKAERGNLRRLEWLLEEAVPGKRYSLEYIRGIAKKALKRDQAPDLEKLSGAEQRIVLDALKGEGAARARLRGSGGAT